MKIKQGFMEELTMTQLLKAKKWWILSMLLALAIAATLLSCGKSDGNGAGGVTFYGAGS